MARRIPKIKMQRGIRERRDTPARFVLFCEGKSTEKKYFDAFRKRFRGQIPKVIFKSSESDPKTIYEKIKIYANDLRSTFEENDQIWAVFDEDGRSHFEEYSTKISNLDPRVNVAHSNPCFELWLILHIETCENPGDSGYMKTHLENIHPQYDHNHGACPNCEELLANLNVAEDRAERQFKNRVKRKEGHRLRRPYTTVYQLTKTLRGT